MERLSGKTSTDDECGPGGIFIEKVAEGFKEKGEVLLIGFPATNGDDLILLGYGRVELKDIGLNGVRDVVNFFWIGTKATSEGFPKEGGRGSFDKGGGEKPKGFP